MSHPTNTILQEELSLWLGEHSAEPTDILIDEQGSYILMWEDFVPEQGDMRKLYLPDNLQEITQII